MYFSADVETDGPIPGPYSMLSFALVYAGSYDGSRFRRPTSYNEVFYAELKPISEGFQTEALAINGLDRTRLLSEGLPPERAMSEASTWIRDIVGIQTPILVAYPLSFDWAWLYWYFTRFSSTGSPFGHSQCYDIKTALAVKLNRPIADSGRSKIPHSIRPRHEHTHHATDDAIEQAQIFANLFEWERNAPTNQPPSIYEPAHR